MTDPGRSASWGSALSRSHRAAIALEISQRPYQDVVPDDDERDRLAEEWLIARHGPEWYIGNASDAEWTAAYAAVDEPPSRGRSES